MERDGHKCCICDSTRRLHVHHLSHRTETERHDHELENLAPLYNSCHLQIHHMQLGKDGGEFVLSGLVFDWLGIKKVKIT